MQEHFSLERLKLLNDEELVLLSKDSPQAFDLLTTRHLPLAKLRAFKFLSKNTDVDDLIGEATFGLLNAIRTFDIERGAAFKTYATTCIDRKLLDLLKLQSRKKRFKAENRVDIDECDIIDYSADPQAKLFQSAEVSRILESAKAVLSPLEFNVIMLLACGYSYSAIALQLTTSTKSVDNALLRARKKLTTIVKIDKAG